MKKSNCYTIVDNKNNYVSIKADGVINKSKSVAQLFEIEAEAIEVKKQIENLDKIDNLGKKNPDFLILSIVPNPIKPYNY